MLSRAAGATAAAAVATNLQPLLANPSPGESDEEFIWDMHGHLAGMAGTPEERIERILKYADRVGIDRLTVFMGTEFSQDPSPQRFRQENDEVLRAVEHSRGRVFGFVYLNPKHVEESLKEMDRCVRDGPMVGVKLWVAARCNQENFDPIVRRAVHLKAPVLQHVWIKTTGNLPGESTPSDLAELAARHPDASFIAAHVGGNWELGIRAIRATKNVTADVSGSDPTAGMVEMAVRELGPERVVFTSDYPLRSFASQLAKVQSADLPQRSKRLILGLNARRMLRPILEAKGTKL